MVNVWYSLSFVSNPFVVDKDDRYGVRIWNEKSYERACMHMMDWKMKCVWKILMFQSLGSHNFTSWFWRFEVDLTKFGLGQSFNGIYSVFYALIIEINNLNWIEKDYKRHHNSPSISREFNINA